MIGSLALLMLVAAGPSQPATTSRAPMPELPAGDRIRVADFVAALEAIAVDLEDEPAVQDDYARLVAQHGLLDTPELRHDYVRVRMIFESARDGGLWSLRWDITNRDPDSKAIWAQWRKASSPITGASAVAECDELSALFAHLVYRLGVRKVGLFWPVWNHVVAVWTVPGEHGPVRLVVPTSQIFLDDDASLGTDGFDPRKRKHIYEYRGKDVHGDTELPAALVRELVERTWTDADRSHAELQRRRNARSRELGGS
ncbi:MAG: hypothetical protein IAG13_26895 [Deltaproteobacteria bacterium]|nr:hypothetical protein [Nannocystaceae bacterium]